MNFMWRLYVDIMLTMWATPSFKGDSLKALAELNSGKKAFSNFVKVGVTRAVELILKSSKKTKSLHKFMKALSFFAGF